MKPDQLDAAERVAGHLRAAGPPVYRQRLVERTFSSINTLFCQHVAGYTRRDTTRRGPDVAEDAIWTVAQLQEFFDEWVIACWQNRPHEGLSQTWGEGRGLSPNEM